MRKNKYLNIYVFTSKYVIKSSSPIVYVSHENDGDWQFLGVENNLKAEDAMIVSLGEILKHDPSILLIMDLPFGKVAIRKNIEDNWQLI